MQYATYNSVVITPLEIQTKSSLASVLDVPFPIRYLQGTDENGDVINLTFRDLLVQGNDYPVSADGKYIALYIELSDLHNEPALLKQFLRDSGMILGGATYNSEPDNAVWYLTMTEWLGEFKDSFLGVSENES